MLKRKVQNKRERIEEKWKEFGEMKTRKFYLANFIRKKNQLNEETVDETVSNRFKSIIFSEF